MIAALSLDIFQKTRARSLTMGTQPHLAFLLLERWLMTRLERLKST